MKRAWVGVALLAVSWLAGTGYYHHADWLVWTVLVAVGTLLLIPFKIEMPNRAVSGAALIALIPVIVLAPWPMKILAILPAAAFAVSFARIPRRWPAAIAGACLTAGAVLTAQALAIFAYQSFTARSHDLPGPLADLLGFTARCAGIDASAADGDVALHTMRKLHRLAATWDLLVDPATFCFLAGGLVLLVLRGAQSSGAVRKAKIARSAGVFTAALLAWLPIRATLLMALLVHRALRVEYDSPLILTEAFRSTWLALGLLSVPILLAWRFASGEDAVAAAPEKPAPTSAPFLRPMIWAAAATLAGVFTIAFAYFWDPPGTAKQGRVLVDEYHSKWEPTKRPYDTSWYGNESGYNYACIYDYLDHYYTMGRVFTPIDDHLLSNCDVLVCKVPTERYAPAEVDAIERFVHKGGGLLLVGEHTDVFGTGVSLNDIAGRFGFAFRYDVILDTDTSFKQAMEMPLVPHPILQRLPAFDFAVSCSIAPGASGGEALVVSRSLRGLGPDYHASNFYPQVDDTADERYGPFVQCWATRQGRGRVVAWSDSTVWSNFCTCEPGKSELMFGLVNWLNQRNGVTDLRYVLWLVGLLLATCAVWQVRRSGAGLIAWPPMLAAGLLGWAAAAPAVRAVHLAGLAEREQHRSFHRLAIDRTVCTSQLSQGGFVEGKPEGFGIFERWILRLGYFTRRVSGSDALHDDVIVFTYPNLEVPADFRDALVAYVKRGGKVLLIDSPENKDSTANSLLYPFNLQVNHQTNESGDLVTRPDWATPHVAAACEIVGGQSLIALNGKSVAATARYGSGSVTVIGFGSRWGDASMGVTGDTIPDDDLSRAYALEYAMMRWEVEGIEPALAATAPATTAPATIAPATTAPATTLPTPGIAIPQP